MTSPGNEQLDLWIRAIIDRGSHQHVNCRILRPVRYSEELIITRAILDMHDVGSISGPAYWIEQAIRQMQPGRIFFTASIAIADMPEWLFDIDNLEYITEVER